MLPPTFTSDFMRQLELLKIRSRRAFLGTRQGGHISPKRGHGIEFSDYRKYEQGDDPRHIDWTVFARNERLYVKLFQEEQDLSVLILIDSTASMVTPSTDGKWEMARDVALALSYVALMEQDRVSIAIPDVQYSPFFSGAAAIHGAGRFLEAVRPGTAEDLLRGVQQAASRMRFPGVAILISDFLMPLEEVQQIFGVLRAKNLDITAVQLLGPSDINPLEEMESVIAIDSESYDEAKLVLNDEIREDYNYLLIEHNERIKDYLLDHNISYALGLTTQNISEFIINELLGTVLL